MLIKCGIPKDLLIIMLRAYTFIINTKRKLNLMQERVDFHCKSVERNIK